IASLLAGTSRAFTQPSIYSIVPRIVPREKLAQASAWLTSTSQIARISGPGVGGLFFAWLGAPRAAGAICVVLAGAIGCVAWARPVIHPEAPPPHRSAKEELFSGLRFVFGHPILLPALSLDMIAVLFGGVTALLPIYTGDILHVGA